MLAVGSVGAIRDALCEWPSIPRDPGRCAQPHGRSWLSQARLVSEWSAVAARRVRGDGRSSLSRWRTGTSSRPAHRRLLRDIYGLTTPSRASPQPPSWLSSRTRCRRAPRRVANSTQECSGLARCVRRSQTALDQLLMLMQPHAYPGRRTRHFCTNCTPNIEPDYSRMQVAGTCRRHDSWAATIPQWSSSTR